MTAEARDGRPPLGRRPTRRGVLLGAGLAGLGGALAGCSTAAVPYGADEAGALPLVAPGPSTITMPAGPPSSAGAPSASPRPARPGRSAQARRRDRRATVTGIVLGSAREIPVGGGQIFDAERVVVTQPARGRYRAFSAVCTHVGCLLNQVAEGTIDCPCHGSRFRVANGAVVTGPAPRALPKKRIKIIDGLIVLV